MIRIDNVSFCYKRHRVFDGLSLELKDGNIYGLLGLNGAGKSTMLYLMSGLLRPTSGSVLFCNVDSDGKQTDPVNVIARTPEMLQNVYLVPEEFSLPNMTMEKYVKINSVFYPRFSDEMMNKSLGAFGMTKDVNLGQLSMGQKKKAFMCFALATNTRILLMDEPSNGLDIPSKSQFRKAVAECMTDDRTIVISTHQVKDIENLLDRVVIVDNAKVLVDDSVSHITEKLAFVHINASKHFDNVVYSQPFMGGALAVVPNTLGQETTINVEVLFNAALSETDKVMNILNN